jgi:PRTRC genetic system protein A
MSIVTHAMNLAYKGEPKPQGLIGYTLNREGAHAFGYPPQGAMYDYLLAADGLYLYAQRDEMLVSYPIASAQVRGLQPLGSLFDFDLPHVPENLVGRILQISRHYAESSLESLFWLRHSELNPYDNGWLLEEPAQDRWPASCRPHEGQEDLYDRVIIEIHSHHSMPARFSGTDDKDETGFRLYGVIGNLPERPEIRMRVGVYGAGFWEIPASWALELPAGLSDCNPDPEQEEEGEEL